MARMAMGAKNIEKQNSGMRNAVGYIRVSTVGQGADDRYGKEVQRAAIQKYAIEHNYNIVKWYEDEMSGAKDDRPGLSAILYSKEGKNDVPSYEAVIAFKTDRISRDTKMYFYYLYLLERRGIKLISTVENFDDDEYGLSNIYRSLILFVAEQERKNIMVRTSRGRYAKALTGGHASGIANYGYKLVDKRLVVVPEEAEVIRLVFKLRDAGMTMAQIATYLIDQGIRTRKGSYPGISFVQVIYNNEKLYHGWYRFGKMEDYVPGQQEAILEDERPDDNIVD